MTVRNPVLPSFTVPNTPIFNSDGQLNFTWLKWFQNVAQTVNGAFDQQGNFDGALGLDAYLVGRKFTTLALILKNIDDAGVVTALGIDFARAYVNKNTDHIADATGSPLAGGKVAYAAMVTTGPALGQILVFDGTYWLPHAKATTIAAGLHKWLKSYDEATGLFTETQPAFADISGVATTAQIGSGTPAAGKYVDGATGAWTALPGSIANIQITVGAITIAANSTSSVLTAAMTGLTTTCALSISPASDISAVTGWSPGAAGSVYFTAWPTADQLNYRICNPTNASITLGASTTWNVSAA